MTPQTAELPVISSTTVLPTDLADISMSGMKKAENIGLSVCNYIKETGNYDFAYDIVPYFDGVAPMNKGGTAGAESVFVFFQVGHAAYELVELYKTMGLKTHYNPSDGFDPSRKSYYLHPAGSR